MPLRIIELPSTAAINSGDFFPVSQLVGSKRNTFRITTSQIKTFVTGELSQKVDDISAKVNSYGASKVSLSGDTMTGYLTLVDNPLNTKHAATKGYVDTRINSLTVTINTNSNKYIELSGGNMTGFLTLNSNPVNPLHAATKSYTDAAITGAIGALGLGGGGSGGSIAFVRSAGDTMTGFLNLNANPTSNLQATPKQYVDTAVNSIKSNLNNFVKLSGDALTGFLTLHANPTNNMHPATKGYTDAAIAGAAAGLENNAAITYVKLAGDTMTGSLLLNANPTSNLQAAPKQYVDTTINSNLQSYIPKPINPINGQSLMFNTSTNTWVASSIPIPQPDNVPIGTIIYFPSETAPAGWFICDGKSLDKNLYKDLYNIILYKFGGVGNNFNLPDLRGEFIRGWDKGRGVNAGRVFGSNESDQFESHTHDLDRALTYPSRAGYPAVAEQHQSGNPDDYSAYLSNTSSTGGAETRPRNVALLPCIKYTTNTSLNTVGLSAQDILNQLNNFIPSNSFVGANQLLADNGYQKLPGGLIMQWGTFTTNAAGSLGAPQVVQFPIPFTNKVFNVSVSEDGANSTAIEFTQIDWGTTGKTTLTQFGVYSNFIGIAKFFAIGY